MKFFRIIFSLLVIVTSRQGYSQSAIEALQKGEEINVLYRNERTFGAFIHTRGVAVNYRRSKHLTGTRKSMLEVELATLKHPKEIKVSNSDNSKRFVYGKLNSVAVGRVGVGYQTTLYKKADKKAVEIRSSYFLGANLALAKPNYVLVYRETLAGNKFPQSVKYDSQKYTIDSISGKGPFVDGLSETKLYPGAYAKINLSFEHAAYSNAVRAVEVGAILDYYPKALPIMANNPSENIVITMYLGLVFGKKWF